MGSNYNFCITTHVTLGASAKFDQMNYATDAHKYVSLRRAEMELRADTQLRYLKTSKMNPAWGLCLQNIHKLISCLLRLDQNSQLIIASNCGNCSIW